MKGTLSLVALALVLALAIALASCGGGSSGGGDGGSGSGGSGSADGTKGGVIKTVAIKETEWKLSPSRVTLSKPGTYAFKAEDRGDDQHSLTIVGKGVKGEGGEAQLKQAVNPGQNGVLTVTFRKAGTYEMYCPIDGHKELGMKGKVVVK
jgi:plastocyanin